MALIRWTVIAVVGLIVLQWLGVLQLLAYGIQTRRLPHPPLFSQAGNGGPKILVLGESIAEGVGAKRPKDGVAGLIGQAFPNASVTVITRPFKGTAELIEAVPLNGDYYDAVILTTSGNDLMVSDQERLASDLQGMIDRCKVVVKKNNIVVLGNFDNLWRARYFEGAPWSKPIPWMIRSFFADQTQKVRASYQEVLKKNDLQGSLVEVVVPMSEEYTSTDGIHPNERGHAAFAQPVIERLKNIL